MKNSPSWVYRHYAIIYCGSGRTVQEYGLPAVPAPGFSWDTTRGMAGYSLLYPVENMHEFGIAYDIFKTAQKTAVDHHATQVRRVCVDIGEMSMVNPEQVQFLFETLIEDEPVLREALLEYTLVPPETRCPCGYRGSEKFICPGCGGLPEVVRGREIVVTHIEIEVDE